MLASTKAGASGWAVNKSPTADNLVVNFALSFNGKPQASSRDMRLRLRLAVKR
jgi:hypothetical protein